MTDVAVEVGTSALEALDFTPRCEHSRHNDPMYQRHHKGDAEFLVRAVHVCPDEDGTVDYLACRPWAEHVMTMQDRVWICNRCHWVGRGSEMCIVLCSLDST